MSQVLREHAIGMLTAGMSTRAVAHELNVHFSTISRLQREFQRIRQYIQPALQPQTTCNHTSPGPPHPASSNSKIVWDQPPGQLLQQSVCITKDFLHKLSETVSVKLICMLVILIGVSSWQQFGVVTEFEWANAHIRWHLALWRGVLFTDESWFSLYRADGRQRVWRRVGERFADVNVVDWVAYGSGGVMVWAGVCYGQRTLVHFIDGILNAQRYRDEILRPIVVPFIYDRHLMLQHDNAWTHVARICTQFLEAENIPVLAWQHTHRTCHPLSMFGMLWIGVYNSVFQFLPISCKCTQPLKRSRPTFHNLINSMQRICVALIETNGGHTRYWLVFGPPPGPAQYSKTAHFRVSFFCGQPKAHLDAV